MRTKSKLVPTVPCHFGEIAQCTQILVLWVARLLLKPSVINHTHNDSAVLYVSISSGIRDALGSTPPIDGIRYPPTWTWEPIALFSTTMTFCGPITINNMLFKGPIRLE